MSGKRDHTVSKDEKAVLKRYGELKYDTDVLGPGSLIANPSHTNSSRLLMVNQQLSQCVNIKDPDQPLVLSGFENVLGSFASMNNQTEHQYRIVKKFQKNQYNYVLIGYCEETRTYHAWKRFEVEEHSEGFSTKYNNNYMDSLEVGDTVPKGVYIQKSESFDKYMNYRMGRNLNVVYLVSPYVYEDGILIMDHAKDMFDTYRAHSVEINVADNEILINWFGDEDHYQGLPNVGEKTKKGFCAITRKVDNTKAPYSLKSKNLRHFERGDKKYYVTGRVVDIEVWTNKDPSKMIDTPAMRQVNAIYQEQQRYYSDLYHYMRDIVDGADPDPDNFEVGNPETKHGYGYSDEFAIICEEAHDYVDSSAFFAGKDDSIYGNTRVVLHIVDEEQLIVGSKLVGRSGNKGVIGRILPPEKSWHMEDGTPIDMVVASLGVIGRLNHSQLNEHSINELSATVVSAMKKTKDLDQKGQIVYELLRYLNKDEAKSWKKWYRDLDDEEKAKCCRKIERRGGLSVVQEPIKNANILDIAAAYEQFPANWQRIIFEDGKPSMRKVLCAKMFYIRLKQDPLEKYSTRSRGPVNPLHQLPSKSSEKKKFLAPFSNVPVRFGEMEMEIMLGMVNHPACIADFMMENSTSYEAKLELSKQLYLNDPEDEVVMDGVVMKGKKNIEWIEALINVLGTHIEVSSEDAKDGECFYD